MLVVAERGRIGSRLTLCYVPFSSKAKSSFPIPWLLSIAPDYLAPASEHRVAKTDQRDPLYSMFSPIH